MRYLYVTGIALGVVFAALVAYGAWAGRSRRRGPWDGGDRGEREGG